jgi:hypothetical protein
VVAGAARYHAEQMLSGPRGIPWVTAVVVRGGFRDPADGSFIDALSDGHGARGFLDLERGALRVTWRDEAAHAYRLEPTGAPTCHEGSCLAIDFAPAALSRLASTEELAERIEGRAEIDEVLPGEAPIALFSRAACDLWFNRWRMGFRIAMLRRAFGL